MKRKYFDNVAADMKEVYIVQNLMAMDLCEHLKTE